MTRAILDESQIHPAARPLIGGKHADLVREVQAAIAANQVVVVGMAINPFPRKARKILDVLGTPSSICNTAATSISGIAATP